MAKGDEKRARQELAGIPDSVPFIDPQEDTAENRILKCHLNGVAISEMHLEPQVLAVLDYWATDEGIKEKNERPNLKEPSGITLGMNEFGKSLRQKRDDVKNRGMELYQARDPLKEVADRYAQPGMRPKFLSAAKIKQGTTGDYQVVKDAAGDPVKVHGMILGHIPEDLAVARNKHYRDRGNRLLKEMTDDYKKEGGKTAVSDQD